MDKYGYILKQNTEGKQADKRYHESDLMLMTSFQLREICRREKIIQGVINPMDKDMVIRGIVERNAVGGIGLVLDSSSLNF